MRASTSGRTARGQAASRLLRRRGRGFTLVEVLIAMTIAAVALMAAIRATASLAVNGVELRNRTLAQWSAENRLAQIRIAREWPNPGRRQYDCSQASVAMVCREDVIQTPNPLFRRVEVSVFDADGSFRLARLVGFSTRLP